MTDIEDRGKALAEYANAGGQDQQPLPPPPGRALPSVTQGIGSPVVGAQQVAVKRNITNLLKNLSGLGAAAGSEWTYRFPTRNKDGTTGWIEGASIKLANDLAREYGNCAIEIREMDVGDAWVFIARFSDIETGYSMERAYRQRKSQISLKTRDYDRQQDIAYQIGQSKAIRNVIVNALQTYADFAFEEARNSLVEKIGKNVDHWRQRTLEGLARNQVDVRRVERVVGRAAKDWLAADIAHVVATMKSISDGMSTLDESFPALEEQTPARDAGKGQAAGATGDRPAGAPGSEKDKPK